MGKRHFGVIGFCRQPLFAPARAGARAPPLIKVPFKLPYKQSLINIPCKHPPCASDPSYGALREGGASPETNTHTHVLNARGHLLATAQALSRNTFMRLGPGDTSWPRCNCAPSDETHTCACDEATLPGHGIKKQRHDQPHTPPVCIRQGDTSWPRCNCAPSDETHTCAWDEATLPGHGIKKQRHDQTHTPHEKIVVDI